MTMQPRLFAQMLSHGPISMQTILALYAMSFIVEVADNVWWSVELVARRMLGKPVTPVRHRLFC